ncbi:pyridoxal-phosphate dependent enzyme [Mesorhizobium sp. M2A.F.Ca.ET.037.01.1.1]|uniref:PLP-dependent cysteine synthase family protein n=1 Tax=unclassified Mesorhizobium TaxID=325217 RepID=UPI000F75CE08|nr:MULTISPECIES: cysteine synthase family protein [unclassified Mesorhizobium]RUY01517.1 pyridoxal-phosphate dependent enzyme [Mesorhizobium sp. M2A.F.Ca.ET.040.01.1.1]RVC66217.1 pyridoxal-phosphate dependent enzyme [Mesorhizobium sp. M00.F.Ca.ET.038.03.1.1]AZO34514.1 cysteine synthase family protein [Mesorhizobium sp. M2A.F.Ca.ET.046.03.2.1]RUX18157.1 pyridoxal-phosphate dependent enzyme [Mesorhizobium sp. M2A.F.Ca.ET.037.01.1.1]RWA79099.1 MAG: pyridoxal-phosphate dependent enzyme [Mesorhizob
MAKVLNSVVESIGRTPLVRLERLTAQAGVKGEILAKLEYLNPGFSKKDRAALGIIEEAEKSGAIKPGQTVVELTSGNMGTGLAIVCAVRGYPFVAVMSKGNSEERARMMAALGAEVILVDQLPGSVPGQVSGGDLALVEQATKAVTAERGAFRGDQFHRDGNWLAHYHGTGPEIWDASHGAVDAFVDFIGSGGTYAGVARALKERNPLIKCFIVEPEGAAAAAGETVTQPEHPIQGGGYAMPDLPFLKNAPVDGYLQVSGDEARETARLLARSEGIFGGFSSGANVAAALRLLRSDQSGKTIAVVICDSGLKYLSTDLWS